jgi:hypothetical protein
VGLWAAERLGLAGTEADKYVRTIIDMAAAPAGDRELVRKVAADLAAKGLSLSEAAVENKMMELLKIAATQVGATE